jgi:malate dehydrogenase (oxaloacetate-decarboxylating)
MEAPAVGTTLIIRVETQNSPNAFANLAATIGEAGGIVNAVDTHTVGRTTTVRDVTISIPSDEVGLAVQAAIKAQEGARLISVSDSIFLAHLGGKIHMEPNIPVRTRADLAIVYTPGVARVSMAVAEDPAKAFQLTIKRNTVAVISDGTAVLGLGDIGPLGALPVMEGKCMLFKQFGGVDAFPITLDTKNVDEIVETCIRIAPVFGGYSLEDISSPRCFEIEERLIEALDIPVMHDDQHGTAVVILAAIINAAAVVGKRLEEMTIVLNGSGAAGTATIKLLLLAGVGDVIAVDRDGAISGDQQYGAPHWTWLAKNTNNNRKRGLLRDVLRGADAFIGLSAPNILNSEDIKNMARDPIVFAMANPSPEIMPEAAAPYVAVMGTGRSDFPNQVNNVLAFPGIFRGALDVRARKISDGMKLAAARAIADIVGAERNAEYVIPSVFDPRVADGVAAAVEKAAIEEGLARRTLLAADDENAATSMVRG